MDWIRKHIKKVIGWGLLGSLLYSLTLGVFSYLVPVHAHHTIPPEKFSHPTEGPDQVALVEAPAEAFSRRIELIRSAETSLDFVYHCIKEGETTDCIFAELLRAADRGVHVRVILDGSVGGLTGSHRHIALALQAHPNIEFRSYNPIHLGKPWAWNVLLHDKFILADDRFLILGGRNIGDEYFDPPGYQGKVTYDRDVIVSHTKTSGQSVIPELQSYMEQLWTAKETKCPDSLSKRQRETGQKEIQRLKEIAHHWETDFPEYYLPSIPIERATVPTHRVSLLTNPLGEFKKEPVIGATLARLLQECDTVRIQTPYATSNPYILKGLSKISEKASVEFLTNSAASTPNFPAFSVYWTQRDRFLETGIQIYEYQSSDSIHGKSCTADGHLSVVGSFNLDDRSLYIDTESVLVIDSPEFFEILNGSLEDLFSQSVRVTPENEYALTSDAEIAEPPAGKQLLLRGASLLFRPLQFLV